MADLRKLKDRAAELLSRGKFAKAAGVLGEIVREDPRDNASRQRLAEALRKSGDDAAAVRVYREVADRYAALGQLIKAVAVCKLILEIEPDHRETHAALAALYARRGTARQDVAPAPQPAAAGAHQETSGTGLTLPPVPLGKMELQPLSGDIALTAAPFEPQAAPSSTFAHIVAHARDAQAAGVEDPVTLELQIEDEVFAEAAHGPSGASAAGQGEAGLPFATVPAPEPGAPPPDPLAAPAAPAPSFPFPPMPAPAVVARITPVAVLAQAPGLAVAAAPPPAPALPHIPLFSDLSHEAFVELARRVSLHAVAAGETIVREGDVGESFYVLASGRVRVEKAAAGGPVELARLGEGEFFGEMALLSGGQRVASVIAEEPCDLLEIRGDVLEDLSRAHPVVAASLTRFYRQRLLENVLATSPLFRPFARNDRLALVGRFRTRDAAPGAVLVREGAPSDGLYVVLSGEVDVTRAATGGEALVARLSEGDVFGEMSCLRKGPASATVTARRRAILLWLPRAAFDEVAVVFPPILALVSELTDQRQLELDAMVAARHGDGQDPPILV